MIGLVLLLLPSVATANLMPLSFFFSDGMGGSATLSIEYEQSSQGSIQGFTHYYTLQHDPDSNWYLMEMRLSFGRYSEPDVPGFEPDIIGVTPNTGDVGISKLENKNGWKSTRITFADYLLEGQNLTTFALFYPMGTADSFWQDVVLEHYYGSFNDTIGFDYDVNNQGFPTPTPEPGTLFLLGMGITSLGILYRKRFGSR